jgi:GntR family transcriptional regulator of arabinose operon
MKKYELVENWIKDGIRSARFLPGDQLPSEAQISAELSVARNSVRRAIANLNAQGYTETRKGIGTFCLAPGHATNGSRDVGLLCFATSVYIFPVLVGGVQAALNHKGFHLLLNQTACDIETERSMLTAFRERGVAGVILEPAFRGSGQGNTDLLLDFIHTGVPVVLLDNDLGGEEFNAVLMDDEAGGRIAASYLHEHGHRRIAMVFDADYPPKIRRKDGALELLRDRGVGVPPEWLISYRAPYTAGTLRESVRAVLSDRSDRPSAFFCTSDEEAAEVIAIADEAGLQVPEDLSVMGFDDSPLATHGRVPLTTVEHPTAYMGEVATAILIQCISNPDVRSKTITTIRPRLVERESVLDLRS